MSDQQRFEELKARLAEVHDLGKIASLLNWDQVVTMPSGGAAVRAEQLATLGRLTHERFTSSEVGQLLDTLAGYEQSLPYESDEASLIRVARIDYEKARKVPADLRAEMTRTASLARTAWAQARAASDFKAFAPFLRRTLDLKKRYVDLFQPAGDPYDVLLDDFERGMLTSDVARIFDTLKQTIVPLIAAVSARASEADDACLHGQFPAEGQKAFCLSILRRFGFTESEWRLDPTTHPFATNTGLGDIRLTTRYYEHYLAPSIFGSMHECGHGLYEHGVSAPLERTPLCSGASLGLHESQSRLWENIVGRRKETWQCFYPELRATFPEQFKNVDLDTFYRAINTVKPGFIRVEADELTYALHVILRFELEREMLAGTIDISELPDAWNARMKSYLGVTVPDDARGVLQDVHWSLGYIGYFPTYVLGSILSVQIWEHAVAAHPDLPRQFEQGTFDTLRQWLKDRLHRHGRKFSPMETLERAIGATTIDVEPFGNYLSAKFGDLYGLSSPDAGIASTPTAH